MLGFLVDNIFVVFARKVFHWVEIAPPSRRHLSVFIRSGIHIDFALNGKKQLVSWYNLTGTSICIIHKQPRIWKSAGPDVSRWTEIKDTTGTTIGRDCQLHTSINDKRDDFNFYITNFLFLRSNIPSSPAYGVFSRSWYGTHSSDPRMNVLFWGPGDFPVIYSNRDTSWKGWKRYSGSFMVDTGILLAIFTRMLNDILALDQLQWLPYQTFHQLYGLDIKRPLLLPEVSMEHLLPVWNVSREHLPFWTPGSVPFWDLLMLQLLRSVFPNLPCLFSLFTLNIPRYFLDSAFYFKCIVLGECPCWWTREPSRAHIIKFYGRLRLIRSVLRASTYSV